MSRMLVLMLTVILAFTLNLIACRWGVDVDSTAIMTFAQNHDGTQQVGMFAASYFESNAWASLMLGVLLPMVLLGVGFYAVLRGEPAKME